jgi:hypothetical protein
MTTDMSSNSYVEQSAPRPLGNAAPHAAASRVAIDVCGIALIANAMLM